MNERKFLEQYVYALERDFTSASGESAVWAPNHPKYWGQEMATISLNKNASTPTFSHDDKLLAVGIDEDIHVFHVATQERLQVLRRHTGVIGTVEFAPCTIDNLQRQSDTRYMLVSEGDVEQTHMVILWELDDHGKLVSMKKREGKSIIADATEAKEDRLCLQGHLASYGSSAFSPDSKTIIYMSHNETTQSRPREAVSLPRINLWNVESRRLQHQLLGHEDTIMWAAVSPDNLQVASISWDGTARIWDPNSGVCLHVLGPLGGQLWCGAFSSDAKYLAISQGNPKSYVHVYTTGTGQPVSRFDGFHRAAHSLAWSPDGTMIACGADRGELCIWDPYTGKERLRWRLAFGNPLMSRFAMVLKVQFVDGGRKLIFQINEGTVELYDFESNVKKQFTRRADDQVDRFPRSKMLCSNDSSLLVVPDVDRVLRLWNLLSDLSVC
jgi:WD40 repeat protein